MIIIKVIILYFIQIRHIDDFPSTGTRLVIIIIGIAKLNFYNIKNLLTTSTLKLETRQRLVDVVLLLELSIL